MSNETSKRIHQFGNDSTRSSTDAFVAQDTSPEFSATSSDFTQLFQKSAMYLEFIDSSTKMESLYIVMDYLPYGGGYYIPIDSFSCTTSAAIDEVCTLVIHDVLELLTPAIRVRYRLHRKQHADSMWSYKAIATMFKEF